MTARRIILGADAGGTKTVAWLAAALSDSEFDVVGCGSGGPGNPLRVGSEAALENVAAAITAATADAGLPISDVIQVVVGMAGAGRTEVQRESTHWLKQQTGITQVQVIPDFELVLAAAFPNREGIAVISGTGSVVHGVRGKRRTRVGGWGYLVDDHGSGFWFGRATLRALAQATDGRKTNSTLGDLVRRRFGNTSVADIIASLHDSPDRLSQIASLAPLVFDAATGGDEVADQLITDAATGLAEMIVTAARQLGYADKEVPLAAAGGVFAGTPLLSDRLLALLKEQAIVPATFKVVQNPVLGAVRLAVS